MTPVVRLLHPRFDQLSAHADAPSTHADGGRVARHLVECARCRATVAQIHALGEEARRLGEGASVPGNMLERILAAPVPDAAVVDDPFGDPTRVPTSMRSTRAWTARGRRALLGVGVAIAAALVALVVRPEQRDLMAVGTARLTFSPGRPRPGGMLTVRYQPIAQLAGAPRLVLAGRYLRPSGAPREAYTPLTAAIDSLATLQRRPDGSYEGRFRLPVDFLGVRMVVFDSTGEHHDQDGARWWVAIGGARDGGPSLPSFLAAYEAPVSLAYDDSASRAMLPRQAVSVADSIQRYFPEHPAGWALYDRYGVRRGRFDFLSFFESAERKYASVAERLWPQRGLDADHLAYMVRFARRIDEPVEVERWTMRLVREHPEDPRAFTALASVLHDLELRAPTTAGDSIRKVFPLLDTLYRRSHAPVAQWSVESDLVGRYGDAETRARWVSRAGGLPSVVVYSDSVSPASERLADSLVAAVCTRADGKFTLMGGVRWTSWCQGVRVAAWAHLARASLVRGETARAAAVVDSSLAVGDADCFAVHRAYVVRADVRIAMRDSVGAVEDLARAYGVLSTFGSQAARREALRARAVAWFGARVLTPRFEAVADSATAATRACKARQASRPAR